MIYYELLSWFTTQSHHVSLTFRRFARKFDLLGGAVKVEPSHELVESAGITEVSNANIDPEDLSITSTLYFVLIFCSCLYSCSLFATLICSKMWFKSVFHGKQRDDIWTCEVVTEGSESESVPLCQKSAKRCRQPWVFLWKLQYWHFNKCRTFPSAGGVPRYSTGTFFQLLDDVKDRSCYKISIDIRYQSKIKQTELGGGNSHIFYFHPYLEKRSILIDIFQMGWFNHQLDKFALAAYIQLSSPPRFSATCEFDDFFCRGQHPPCSELPRTTLGGMVTIVLGELGQTCQTRLGWSNSSYFLEFVSNLVQWYIHMGNVTFFS